MYLLGVYDLFDFLSKVGPPWSMIIAVVLIGSCAGIVKTAFKQCRIYASHRAEVNLKRELVERGLSVDEIERVVAAKSSAAC